MKKLSASVFIFIISFLFISNSTAYAEDYPSREITGIVQLNKEDAFDMRDFVIMAEENLKQPVSVWAFSKNSNASAVKYFESSLADGYTFLAGAERVGKNVLSYESFECIYVLGDATEGLTIMPFQGTMSVQALRYSSKNFKYIPYGCVYGVYVKKGTPENVIKKLSDAFKKAGENPKIREALDKSNIKFIGLTGKDAQEYVSNWRGGTFDTLLSGITFNPNAKIPEPIKKTAAAQNSQPDTKPSSDTKSKTASGYPAHDIDGINQWGPGGATDVLMRAATTEALKFLPVNIKIQNIVGNNGANGLEYVYSKNADGYTLLIGAGTAAIYDALSNSTLTYNNFECVYLLGDLQAVVAVDASSRYHSFTDIVKDAQAHPETVTCGTTGHGSASWILNAFITDATGAKFKLVDYDDTGSMKEGLKRGDCDFIICLAQESIQEFSNGTFKFLTLFAIEESNFVPGVTPVISEYPQFLSYLPWGNFFGIFAKEGTDWDAIDMLSDAYKKAGENKEFRKLLEEYGLNYLGYTGEEAEKYIAQWRSNTIDALVNSGAEGVTMPAVKAKAPRKRPAMTAQNSQPAKKAEPASQKTTASGYPDHAIDGIIQWGAGGVTDLLTRALTEEAMKNLPQEIKMQNITGNSGATGLEFVHGKQPDGYTLLMGAENPALYDKLGISNLTYDDFECVYLIGDVTAGIIVNPNSQYDSFKDLIADAKARPGEVTAATTGKGSVGWVMNAFINGVTGATFRNVDYDSTAAVKEAVIKGECDFSTCLLQQGIDEYNEGKLKFLTVIAIDEHPKLQGVPAVIEDYPGFFMYLPWGSFYGVFAKKGTPPEVIELLGNAYKKAGEEKRCRDLLEKYNVNYLGYIGNDAKKYISSWRSNTVDALITSGALD